MAYSYEWKDSCGQPYLEIEADSPYELGVAYGKAASDKIIACLEETDRELAAHRGDARLESLRRQYEACIPENYMEEIRGICDGLKEISGRAVSPEDMALQSYSIDLANKLKAESIRGCTNFGIINSDGSVTHGQNYDAGLGMMEMSCFCLQRLKGHPAMFILRYGGSLALATAKNEYGVCMTVSIVKTNQAGEPMVCRSVLVREAMEKRTAREAIETMAPGGRSSFSYNLVVSDNHTVVASQAIPGEQRITCVKDWVVQSNQYEYVDWQKYLLRPAYSKKRQFYAEQQLREWRGRYGYVTDTDLIEILRDEPVLCRTKIADGIGTTVFFFTRESFGIGNALKAPIGRQPL